MGATNEEEEGRLVLLEGKLLSLESKDGSKGRPKKPEKRGTESNVRACAIKGRTLFLRKRTDPTKGAKP